VARAHAHPKSLGVIDEASRAEKGDKTPGVQRQYCGSVGKGENGIVTVYLGYAAGEFHCLLEGDLFLFPNRRRDGLKMPWRDALRRVQTSADGRRQSRPRRSVALHAGARGPPSGSTALPVRPGGTRCVASGRAQTAGRSHLGLSCTLAWLHQRDVQDALGGRRSLRHSVPAPVGLLEHEIVKRKVPRTRRCKEPDLPPLRLGVFASWRFMMMPASAI